MQRRVLQKLRSAPFDPGVRRLGERRTELIDEPRLAEARFADDQHDLAFAGPRAFPAARQQAQLLLAADERRQNSSAAPSTAAAGANDAEELDRLGYAFEFARA